MRATKFNIKNFIVITLYTSIWINISEVFRYFIFVRPRVKLFFRDTLSVANMDWGIFAIWGLWDTLLTGVLVFFFWLYSRIFGNSNQSVLIIGTLVWAAIFFIFWVATANMGLSDWNILWITLPLSWVEMYIGAWIASKLYKKIKDD